ncbi:hypothetical protein QUF50_09405, partial [Thiotrichales bacterium HSG1]|nr:hypothetical protein [Thiotrichales bacterium HSG1]
MSYRKIKHTSMSLNSLRIIQVFLLMFGILLQPAFASVVVTSGAGQNVPAGSGSEEIVFSVFDEQGNPVTGVSVDFNLVNPTGNSENDAITVTTADTDVNGQVFTFFKGSATMGNYTITATLATDVSQTDST